MSALEELKLLINLDLSELSDEDIKDLICELESELFARHADEMEAEYLALVESEDFTIQKV